MLSVEELKKRVINFPNNKSVEELIDEIILYYKIEKGLKEAEEGKGVTLENFKKGMDLWWKSK
jgi:hypothetical protein